MKRPPYIQGFRRTRYVYTQLITCPLLPLRGVDKPLVYALIETKQAFKNFP